MYTVITGMSENYFNRIGKSMITSWLEYWPNELTLLVYTEDNIDFTHERVKFISLDTMDSGYQVFQNAKIKLNHRSKTFAKKAWPIMTHLQSNVGNLIWIDADVITENPITTEWLNSLMPLTDFSCHLGVPQLTKSGPTFYSVETGFFIINLENRFRQQFLKEYTRIYTDMDFSGMKKPFDGDVFGKVIRTLKHLEDQFSYTDLSPSMDSLSPFNKVFGDRMKHYKAKRKNDFTGES